MPEIWKPQSREIYESWIEAIEGEALDELTKWEFDFITSIHEQISNGRILSQRQAEILERIYTEKTR